MIPASLAPSSAIRPLADAGNGFSTGADCWPVAEIQKTGKNG
jgi:hypothetical protein